MSGSNTPNSKPILYLMIKYNVWAVCLILLITFSLTIKGFFSPENFINILYHSVFIGILAIGETYVLLSKRFDLSIESTAAFSGLISVWLCSTSARASGYLLSAWEALLIVMAIGALIGIFNGFFTIKMKVNSFLVTLASYIFVRAIAGEITSGYTMSGLPDSFTFIDRYTIFKIPLVVFLMLALYLIFEFILRRTAFGKHLYAFGENKSMAARAGINGKMISYRVFVIASMLAALTGWLIAAKTNGASVTIANNYIFEVFLVVVIGGVSFSGGQGRLMNVLAGCLILSIITNVLDIFAVSPFVYNVFIGLLIVPIASFNLLKSRLLKTTTLHGDEHE